MSSRARALLLFDQGRFAHAESELRSAIGADPQDALLHAVLALSLAAQERWSDATLEAQQAVGLGPDVAFTHYAKARVMSDRGFLAEAGRAIEEAIRLDPWAPDYFAVQGRIQLGLRRWSAALTAAERGLAVDAHHTGCANLRAMALLQLGRREDATDTLDAALARDPDNALTHANRGWALMHQRRYDSALEHFRESLRLDPTLDWARSGIVEALKAKNPLYALMLRYFLLMSRLDRRKQWMVVVGGLVLFRVLAYGVEAAPALRPAIFPLMAAYIGFVVLSWIAQPLFNLMLRLNRFGRHALSRDQTVAANWLGACLGGVLLSLALGPFIGWATAGIGALMGIALTLPMSGTFKCARGWPRRAFAGFTAALAASAIGAVVLMARGADPSPFPEIVVIGVVLSTWLGNWLIGVRVKR
jgi:tetratricopeptide (TPR) repeat protein